MVLKASHREGQQLNQNWRKTEIDRSLMNEEAPLGRMQLHRVEDKCLAEQTFIQAAGFLSLFSHAKLYLLIDQHVALRSGRTESIAQHERHCHALPHVGCCWY